MAKQSAFLSRMDAAHRAECRRQRLFSIQQSSDMMLIAANRAFGFGPDRLKRLMDEFQFVFDFYIDLALEDGRADARIEYTRADVDSVLSQALGDYFVPWDVRYKGLM